MSDDVGLAGARRSLGPRGRVNLFWRDSPNLRARDTGAALAAAAFAIGFSPALASAASALARNAGASSSRVAQASDADFTSPRAICQASCLGLRAVSRATKIVADSRWRVNAT